MFRDNLRMSEKGFLNACQCNILYSWLIINLNYMYIHFLLNKGFLKQGTYQCRKLLPLLYEITGYADFRDTCTGYLKMKNHFKKE